MSRTGELVEATEGNTLFFLPLLDAGWEEVDSAISQAAGRDDEFRRQVAELVDDVLVTALHERATVYHERALAWLTQMPLSARTREALQDFISNQRATQSNRQSALVILKRS